MKAMLYMSLFWKIHHEHKMRLKEINEEKKCKLQFKNYLKYLESKDIKINNYVSLGESLLK